MALPQSELSMIETERLILRPMEEADIDPLLEVFSDPLVMACFGVAPFDREQMERWVARNLDHQRRYGYGLFSVIRKSDGKLIGDCGLEVMDEGFELGYDLRSDAWKQGFATEAALAVRDYAYTTLGLDRLVSLIRTGNAASERVAAKAGMGLEKEVERHGSQYRLYSVQRFTPRPAVR